MTTFFSKYKIAKLLMTVFFVFYSVFSCCLMAEAAIVSVQKNIAAQSSNSGAQPSCHGQPVKNSEQTPRGATECQCGHEFSALQPFTSSLDFNSLTRSDDVLTVPLKITGLSVNRFSNPSLLVLDQRLQQEGPPVYLLNENFRI